MVITRIKYNYGCGQKLGLKDDGQAMRKLKQI